MRAAKLAAIATGLCAAGGLVLQYAILVEALGFGLASWRFVGFFTILSNIGIAVIAALIAFDTKSPLTGEWARLMALTAIVTVGIVYSLLLRSLWSPTGLQKLADMALHDLTPILFAILWLLMPHGGLRWSDLKWALAPPAAYLAYALARGEIDGWYAYWFLNPSTQSASELALGIIGVLAVFAAVAAGAIAIDRRLGRSARLAEPAESKRT